MHLNTTIKHQQNLPKMSIIKNLENAKYVRGFGGLKLSYFVGMQNSIFSLENNLAVFHKVKYTFTVRPSNSTSRCLARGNENIHPRKILYIND